MGILLRELDPSNIRYINHSDGTFTVDSKLVLRFEDGEIHYSIVPLSPYAKRYPIEKADYSTYINNPEQTIFLAFVDGQFAGQITLQKDWNQYATIEDITVDVQYRRMGVGRELVARAVRWAKDNKLIGVRLETQDTNVAACRFYERLGFKLCGFDPYLYKGIEGVEDEVALYWYLLFEDSRGHRPPQTSAETGVVS
jgi:ribosomal protein S18 acetylase RimI-like enzyme